MFAIIRTGGKQYLVTPDQELLVEKLVGEPGDEVKITDILLVSDGAEMTKVGKPLVAGAKIKASIVSHGRAKKVTSVKFHNKVRYRRKIGHRQHWTKVKIESITA